MTHQLQPHHRTQATPRSKVTNVTYQRNLYQPSLWGDTYLTPQEARIYLQQMLTMLRANKPERTK